jgi:hypothetical protein
MVAIDDTVVERDDLFFLASVRLSLLPSCLKTKRNGAPAHLPEILVAQSAKIADRHTQ